MSQKLKLAVPIPCATAVAGAALMSFGAGTGQSKPANVQAVVVHVECSNARGTEGRDFARHPSRGICLMSRASFQRLYPEIAQHTDESTWQ